MEKTLIYSVEDDESIAGLIQYALESEGYETKVFAAAEQLFEAMEERLPAMVLLDVMLPGMDGFAALERLRREYSAADIRIIMLTAKDSEISKVKGLDLGADDYVSKPFGLMELLARVRASLRKRREVAAATPERLTRGGLELDQKRFEAYLNGQKLTLTLKEFQLLKYLLQNAGRVAERAELLSAVWGMDFLGETRTLDMHINSLRKKLGDDQSENKVIVTVRGVGYQLL